MLKGRGVEGTGESPSEEIECKYVCNTFSSPPRLANLSSTRRCLSVIRTDGLARVGRALLTRGRKISVMPRIRPSTDEYVRTHAKSFRRKGRVEGRDFFRAVNSYMRVDSLLIQRPTRREIFVDTVEPRNRARETVSVTRVTPFTLRPPFVSQLRKRERFRSMKLKIVSTFR